MKVIVCGGRRYADAARVWLALDELMPKEVAQGGAAGADHHAQSWCLRRGVACRTFAADWAADGRAAGPLRNQRMLDEFKPDIVVAFPGGKGTADMVRRSERAGVQVVEFK